MAEPIVSSRSTLRRQRLAQLELEQQLEDKEAFEAITNCNINVDADEEVSPRNWWELDGFARLCDATNQPQPITPPLTLNSTKAESYSPNNTVKNAVRNHLAQRELKNQRSPIKAVFDIHESRPVEQKSDVDTDATIRLQLIKRKEQTNFISFALPEVGEAEELEIESDIDATVRRPTAKRTCHTSVASPVTRNASPTSDRPLGSPMKSKFSLVPKERERRVTTTTTSTPPASSGFRLAPVTARARRARALTLASTSGPTSPAALDRVRSQIGGETQRKVTPASGVLMGGASETGTVSKRKRGF